MAAIQRSSDQSRASPNYLHILEASPLKMVVCEDDFAIHYANAAFRNTFWNSTGLIFGHKLDDVLTTSQSNDFILEPGTIEKKLTKANGTRFWGQIESYPSIHEDGKRLWIVQITDITERKVSETQKSYLNSIWRNAIKASGQGVWDYYAPTQSHYYSDEWREIRGISKSEDLSNGHKNWMERLHPDDRDHVINTIEELETGNAKLFTYEYRERHQSGKYIWISVRGLVKKRDENGRIEHVVGTDVDITALKERDQERNNLVKAEHEKSLAVVHAAQKATESAQKKAEEAASKDPLTNLPNRRAFSERLEFLGRQAREAGLQFALMIVDLDRFKPVNDTHGHSVGDRVICEVANRLQSEISPPNLAARLGGDEFGVLIEAIPDTDITEHAGQIAQGLISRLCEHYTLGSIHIDIGACIGIACETASGKNTNVLLKRADMALYHAKQNHRGSFQVFDTEMSRASSRRSAFEADVRAAVREEAFVPHFQPIIDLETNKVIALELLSRWQHPEHGSVDPSKFIPAIEQLRLSKNFGQAMFRQASEILRTCPGKPRLNFNITVNGVSDPSFPDRFLGEIREHGLTPEKVEIEIKESALMRKFDAISDNIRTLRTAGIRVSLDDFGIGNAGLSSLRELEVDSLKLDRSFTLAMQSSVSDFKIIETVLSIAENFGMDVVAEGIENNETKKMLRDIGYRFGQGFLFSPALPADEIPIFLEKWSNSSPG